MALAKIDSKGAAQENRPKPTISLAERRVKSGALFAAGSRSIPLTEPGRWALRVVNTDISDARLWEMQADKGWTYAAPEDIDIEPQEIGFRVQDGRLVRGTRGSEVLMKMPTEDFRQIQAEKDRHNRVNTFGRQALKSAIVGAAATQLQDGGRGAEFLDRAVHRIGVKDSLERVNLDDAS